MIQFPERHIFSIRSEMIKSNFFFKKLIFDANIRGGGELSQLWAFEGFSHKIHDVEYHAKIRMVPHSFTHV